MNLSEQEFELFTSVFSPLIIYANQQRQVLPEINSQKKLLALDPEKRYTLHGNLYDNIYLVDQFIADNPNQLTEEQLKIASGFKRFVRGDFFIERFLSKYAIFIDEKDNVYAVLGLTDPLADLIHKSYLPLSIYATLLPFKGKIVYDGLFKSRNILFGGGIKGELKEVYMAAKQCGRIIETLEKSSTRTRKKPSYQREWLPVINELKKASAKLDISADDPAVLKSTLSVLKSSLILVEIAANSPDDWNEIDKALKKISTSLSQVDKIIERAQRYQ